MTRTNLHYLYILLSISTLSLLLMSGRQFFPTHDDTLFPKLLAQFDSTVDYLLFRYKAWSGRVLIDLLLPYVLKSDVWLWRILNAIAITFLLSGIWVLGDLGRKTTSIKEQWLLAFSVVFLFFMSKGDVLEWGVFWATGSMNYLWPTACLFGALIPYCNLISGKKTSNLMWFFTILPGIYASYQEQTALILITFALLCLVFHYFHHGRFSIPGALILVLFASNFFLLITAPGNVARLEHEVVKFYPNFHNVSLIEKIKLGINYTLLNHFFYESVKHFFIIPILTVFLAYKEKVAIARKIPILFSLLYIAVCLLFARGLEGEFGAILNLDLYGTISENTATKEISLHLLPIFLGILALMAIPIGWLAIFSLTPTCFKLILFYFAGICSSFVLSFSPTMYASGYRIFFVPEMMMLVVVFILLSQVLKFIQLEGNFFLGTYLFFAVYGTTKIAKLIF